MPSSVSVPSTAPPEGSQWVILDAPEEKTQVERIGDDDTRFRVDPPESDRETTDLCVTPCVASLKTMKQRLRFRSPKNVDRWDTVDIQVPESGPLVVRHVVGRFRPGPLGPVPGGFAVAGGASVVLGAAFVLSGLGLKSVTVASRDNPVLGQDLETGGFACLGVGGGLLLISLALMLTTPGTELKGSTTVFPAASVGIGPSGRPAILF